MNETTRSSANTAPQLLSEEGGIQLRDFNPKAILRFTGRRCATCNGEILDHWIIYAKDPDLRSEYWCDKEGTKFSQGLLGCTFDVEGIRTPSEPVKSNGSSKE